MPPSPSASLAGQSKRRIERIQLLIGSAALTLFSFVASVLLGRELFATGVFREWNILFDADPIVYFRNFASGKTIGDWGGRSFVHPNLTNFIHPPLWVIGEVLSRLPQPPGTPNEIREGLAFLVSPLFASVRVPLLVLLVRQLGLSVGWTLALVALDTVSFSTRLFASIPESYLIAGTMLLVVFWMTARAWRSERPPRLLLWGAVLFVLFGIAALNVVAGTILLAVALWRHHPPLRAIALSLAVAGVAFGLNALAYEATRRIYPSAPPFHPMGTGHLVDSWNPRPTRIVDFALGLGHAYFPSPPGRRPYRDFGNTHDFAFTFERHGRVDLPDARPLVVLLLVAAGIACYRWLPAPNRPVYWAAVAILAFGMALHSFLGKELALYTQLWKAPAIVLLAGLYYLPNPARNVVGRGLPWLVLILAFNSSLQLREIVNRLAEP